jgi:ATP-dependent DNA ligase
LSSSTTDSGLRPTLFAARLISRNGSRMGRFEEVLDRLPKGHVFDGELVVLDDAGRPLFNELLFGRRRPTYVALAEFVGMREQIQQT